MRTRSIGGAAVAALAISLLTAGPAAAHGSNSYEVDTRADTADARTGDGECADGKGACSLRAAIQEANASGGGEIELDGDTRYVLSIGGDDEDAAATGDLDITSRITVDGDGATVDAKGIDRVFHVVSGASLTLDEVTVTGGVADGDGEPPAAISGGGVLNMGTLRVDRSTITGNSAVRAGGGIEAAAGTSTTVDRSTLSKNTTGDMPGNGGGLHITSPAGQGGTVVVERSTVTGNSAAREGGGLWNDAGSTMTVSRTTFTGNSANGPAADDGGGALFNNGGRMTVERSQIRDNEALVASGSGGGILNLGGNLEVGRTVIDGNRSARAGGGIEANLGTTVLSRTELTDNRTGDMPGNGGGLHITSAAGAGGSVIIDRGVVTGNVAANEGGGLWNDVGSTMTVTDTKIRGNDAPTGPNVFQQPPDGDFSVDGEQVPAGDNDL